MALGVLILRAYSSPQKPTVDDCSAEAHLYAELMSLLLSDDESRSDMASDPASHPDPTGKVSIL